MDFSLSGLASGFDWKTFIDQIMAVQNAPIDRLNAEKTANTNKKASLADLETKITALQSSVGALGAANVFNARKATSATASTTWTPQAAAGTSTGSYQVAVSQLATTARIQGAQNIGAPLNTTDDVSGLTLATLPTTSAVSAGTFSVNGQKVTVALTDSLDQVFSAISTATGGAVTAAYDHITDKITLSGTGPIMLGAANDTSNFLSALKLSNNGTNAITSSGELGAVSRFSTLASSRLSAAIAGSTGSFLINGVNIDYDVNADSLDTIMQRINRSTAGVTASYDGSTDRVVLTNSVTGDTGISVSETAGGLMDALGLTGGAAFVRGKNAEFTLNGGSLLTSASNNLDEASHGIAGLNVTVNTLATQTISVSGDTESMKTAVNNFISKFNEVQQYLSDETKVSKSIDGKVSSAVLSSNREVQEWATSLRSKVFASVPGLTGTIKRLEDMGIDFQSGSSLLYVKNGIKLDTALRDKAGEVTEFFQTASTGMTAQLDSYLTNIKGRNNDQEDLLVKNNTDIDRQIADIKRRLDRQRATLTASFVAMENAQSRLKSQSDALTRAFPVSTTKS